MYIGAKVDKLEKGNKRHLFEEIRYGAFGFGKISFLSHFER